MSYEEVLAIKKLLKHTWKHYFRRFGKLLPVQVKAIPEILQGHNVIIMSPTASGKTEAVMAPLTEILIVKGYEPPNTIYISPTRALAYDLYERLHKIIEDAGLSIALRTGERRQFSEKNPQDIVLTTPESLDSMLCRNTDLLSHIRNVVLDELHLIHGNYRGDQLKLDLKRLEQITGPIHYCALSATFNDPYYVASQYFDKFKMIMSGGAREINYRLFRYDHEIHLKETLQYCKSKHYKKILFFCNSRAGTEVLADNIKQQKVWPEKNVYVHHGSLSRSERDRAEEALRHGHAIICVATMTLEVGIDIGDIDLIVLHRPPLSVSSLLQRIGRGNRRSNETNAIGLYINEKENEEFRNLFEKAAKGEIEDIENGPCLSVAIQQTFSYLYQHKFKGVSEERLVDLLSCLPMKVEHIQDILTKLIDDEYIQIHRGLYYPTTRVMDMANIGIIHANIPGGYELKVVDAETGQSIGQIERLETINQDFMLSGKKWKVSNVSTNTIKVSRTESQMINPAVFPGVKLHGRFFNILPPNVKRECCKPIIT